MTASKSTRRLSQESSRAFAAAESVDMESMMTAVFKMSPRPTWGVPLDKTLKPREGVTYRTPTGRLAVLQDRKQDDHHNWHFRYTGLDPRFVPQDGVGRARAFTGEPVEKYMGAFALTDRCVGILREVA